MSRCTSTYITIYGTNFGLPSFYYPYGANITFGDMPCRVLFHSNENMIRCLLTRSQPTDSTILFSPLVNIWGVGYAQVLDPSAAQLTSAFHVYSVSPQLGSIYGGTRITLTGAGFKASHTHEVQLSAYADYNNYFRFVGCTIDATVTNDTHLECIVSSQDIFTSYTGIDWSVAPEPFPFNVVLSMGFINAQCVGDASVCQFNFTRSISPTVTSIFPTSGTAGTVITITGTNLNANANVTVNVTQCENVQSPDPQTLTCTIAPHMAGKCLVQVSINGVGAVGPIATSDSGPYYPPLYFFHELSISSVSPSVGSRWGGTSITIQGTSFNTKCPQANIVTIRPSNNTAFTSDTCIVTNVSDTTLVCITPSFHVSNGAILPLDVPLMVVVTVVMIHGHTGSMNSMTNMSVAAVNAWAIQAQNTGLGQTVNMNMSAFDCPSCVFTLDSSFADIPISISPTSGKLGTTVTIRGSGFANPAYVSLSNPPVLVIGPTFPTISFWNDTVIIATIGMLPAGAHPVRVTIGECGATERTTFFSNLNITALSYTSTGYGGGVPLTISGFGFGNYISTINISLCNVPCNVTSTTYNSVVCTPGPLITNASLSKVLHAVPLGLATNTVHSSIASSPTLLAAMGAVIDQNVTSPITIPTAGWIGLDFGVFQQYRLTRIRFFAAFTQAATLNNGVFQGCNAVT